MKPIEDTESPVLVRTDFSDQKVWDDISALIQEPKDPFFPNTEILDNQEYEGASTEEISSMKKEMEDFNQLYENTFVRFGVTLLEILPVGIIITLLSAAILRRREIFPATR